MFLKFQDAYYRRLAGWSIINLIIGIIVILLYDSNFLKGVALLYIIWGLIIGIFAYSGINKIREKIDNLKSGTKKPEEINEEPGENNILAGVICFIIACILLYPYPNFKLELFIKGFFWALLFQSLILLIFQVIHKKPQFTVLEGTKFQLFEGPEHKSFTITGGKPAAILLHSFTGSPDEMRDIAEIFQEAGWTVSVPLLQGFGPDLKNSKNCTTRDWIDCVIKEISKIKKKHSPLVLVTYSTSCAIGINIAATIDIDGLVLLSPLCWHKSIGEQIVEFFFKIFIPDYYQPFRDANFSDPALQVALKKLLPDMDIDNKKHLESIRYFTFSSNIIEKVREIGTLAYKNTGAIQKPVLIIQNIKDNFKKLQMTQDLIDGFSYSGVTRKNLNTGMDLISDKNPKWNDVRTEVLKFSNSIKG